MSEPAEEHTSPQEPDQLPGEVTRAPFTAFAVGWASGVLSALLGVGGGIILVPGMAFLLRIRQHRAVGTSLAVIIPTALAAAVRYHHEAVARQSPGIELWVVVWLSIGGVAGAILGATLANALGGRQLRHIFGLFLAVIGLWVAAQPWLSLPEASAPPAGAVRLLAMLGVGVLFGTLSGLLGVGGGVITVPALVLLLGYPQHQAQATSLAVIIPASLSGALVHLLRGNVIDSLLVPMALGSIFGAWLMAGTVYRIPENWLQGTFGIFMVGVGISMALNARRRARESAEGSPPAE